jgi:protocatechuate 3,4-dioxygenase beta subunit
MYSRISGLLLALMIAVTGLVSAQERFGTLQGKALDEQGSPVPGVTVTVTNLATNEARSFVTDANGQYLAADLNPGRYKPT